MTASSEDHRRKICSLSVQDEKDDWPSRDAGAIRSIITLRGNNGGWPAGRLMNENVIAVVFFDLGDTLGKPIFSLPPVHLKSFEVFPFVPPLLEQLKSRGLRLGLISNTGDETGATVNQILKAAGILEPFEPTLRIYSKDVGLTKDDPEIFRLATARAGFSESPSSCLFVGEDARERNTAVEAGMRVSPHPLLVTEVLAGETQ